MGEIVFPLFSSSSHSSPSSPVDPRKHMLDSTQYLLTIFTDAGRRGLSNRWQVMSMKSMESYDFLVSLHVEREMIGAGKRALTETTLKGSIACMFAIVTSQLI